MEEAIPLALAASFFTATASVCQRLGARNDNPAGFDPWLIVRLARRPVWLLGMASMILGFVFQVSALRFGPLALVQPILAAELLFVFAYLAVIGPRRAKVRGRDWLAAIAMSAGIGIFLRLAAPSGGQPHAPGFRWWLAGLITLVIVVVSVAIAFGNRSAASGARRAAVLGTTTGISWGFVAAVIKEFSSHLGDGASALLATWSPYVLAAAGGATVVLASHALASGPLAASQPGFTVMDPLAASVLGVFLFGEHIQASPLDLAGEILALALLAAGAATLSHSHLIADLGQPSPRPPAARREHDHHHQAC